MTPQASYRFLLTLLALGCAAASSEKLVRRERLLSYFDDNFADGLETDYNQYAQAWRYLGLYVDCEVPVEEQQRRSLEDQVDEAAEGDDAAAAEGDEADAAEGDDAAAQEEEQAEPEAAEGYTCKRYLLWGAYVDLDYQGNGLTEYKIYDTETKSWDKTACEAGEGDRCAKMDCHLQGTRFKPLGYFRQDNPVEFLTTVLYNQGSCSWNGEETQAITDASAWLPQQCTYSGVRTQATEEQEASFIYFDLKPLSSGSIGIGLYTDARCAEEYVGDEVTADQVVSQYLGESVSVTDDLELINSALDSLKVCSPCRTFDLSNEGQSDADEEAADDQDPNNDMFFCNDAAGNAGVNQCLVLAQNTEIRKADLSEVFMASTQGTIQRTFGAEENPLSWWDSWGFMVMSILIFIGGLFCFCCFAVERSDSNADKRQPLISKE